MYDDVFARHERVALQFSGGKDSIAVLYLLRPYWNRLTVYYCDSGDSFPETRELMDRVRAEVPRFCTVPGRQRDVVAVHGNPSDLVPSTSTFFGRTLAGDTGVPMIDRYACCHSSIMSPLHEKMVEDGITLIIRGQKLADDQQSPIKSGDVVGGVEVLFPIAEWTDSDVLSYIEMNDLPLPRFYTMGKHGHDCMSCTAWLEKGQGAYMHKYHSNAYERRREKLLEMRSAIARVLPTFID